MRKIFLDMWPALAYGMAYVPFAALSSRPERDMLLTSFSCWVAMLLIVTGMRFWHRVHITPQSLLCGAATGVIILTTIVGYGLPGTSMLLMAVLMRAGVLTMAPILDIIRGNQIRPQSRLALALTFSAVLAAVWGRATAEITPVALLTVGLYLGGYAVRLHVMGSVKAEPQKALSLLASEQVLSVSLALAGMALWGAIGPSPGMSRSGPHPYLVPILVGVLSQLTGVFGGLVLAGRREHTYCAPLNRCASTLGVLIASLLMGKTVTRMEIAGVCLIVLAVLVLSAPARFRKITPLMGSRVADGGDGA